ncbi:MAG: protein-glutamate O-methyltransferase CheR [Pseudomonadota bacterium]
MDDEEFRRWVALLEERTGVVVPQERKQFLETNLRLRMREVGADDFEAYHRDLLSGRRGAVEWAVLVDRLTVHQTHFFRHRPSLEMVADEVLPDFVVRTGGKAAFHAWSVGCSTGEEAYSLAMVIDRYAAKADAPFHYGVTASDVSQPALVVGRSGRYPNSKLSEIPPEYRELYCVTGRTDSFVMHERLLKRVGFAMLNLLDVARQPLSHLDLIYCQNVLIYFPRERRLGVLDQLVKCLRPGGHLILGPGEMTGWRHPLLTRVAGQRTLAYRRRAEEPKQ